MPKWYGGSTLNPDELIPSGRQWLVQWQRLERWHRRACGVHKKSLTTELQPEDFDTIIAFFQNAYHLRDWLCSAQPSLESDLKALFHTKFEMGACRDICNGFKHKAIDRPSHDADFNLYRVYDYFEIEGLNPVKYRIAFADGNDIKKFDLFDLVQAVHVTWQGFLKDKGCHVGA